MQNSYDDWQLVIGDSSTLKEQREAIRQYCEGLEKEDSRIIFKQYRAWSEEERERKCEFATKINKMAKEATGDWFTYLNDDDLYHSHYYQAYKDVIDGIPEVKIVYTGQHAMTIDGQVQYSLPAINIKRCMFFCVDQNCVAHRRELLEEVNGWCTDPWVNGYADAEFWWKLAQKGYLAYPTSKYTSIKTIHAGQISAGAKVPYDNPLNIMQEGAIIQ